MNKYTFPALLCAGALLFSGCSSRTPATEQPMPEQSASVSELPLADGDLSLDELTATGPMEDWVVPLASASQSLDLSYPRSFAITRPTEKLTTSLSSFFITGTSDPSQSVYFGDTEIQRMGTTGLFGVHVELAMGSNTFAFRQGDKTQNVTIVRTAPTIGTISSIPQSSMYPRRYGSGRAGDVLLAECHAPSGSKVTANFGGQTVSLEQVAQAQPGVEAVFRGEIPLGSNYPAGEVTKQGKITYTLTYGGSSKSSQSSGEVYIAGQGAVLAVQVNEYLGIVNAEKALNGKFRSMLKQGAVDTISGQDNDYYYLSSGGYLSTESAVVLSGKPNIQNSFSSCSSSFQNKSETYTFQGVRAPAYYARTGESSFVITFYNTSGTPAPNIANSRLFSNVSVKEDDNSVTYTFTQKGAGNLWGYNISHDGGNTHLRFAYKPRAGTGDKPLSGITIVVDPGHGGKDPGAAGIPGTTGPNEALINLAHGLAVRDALQAKGAKVVMTRSTKDGFLELNERLEVFEKSQADLFVSLHHNSLGMNTDANKVNGMEVYYFTPSSKNFANYLMSSLGSGTGRRQRFVQSAYYRVTILPYAPSALCELGYLCNPLEYENSTNQAQINKTAESLANGIVRSLS